MIAEKFFELHGPISRSLRTQIHQYAQILDSEELQSFLNHVGSLLLDLRYKLSLQPIGVERAEFLHNLLEIELKKADDVKTSCAKGCSACCHYEVEITYDEAKLLANLVSKGLKIDRNRLQEQAKRVRQDKEWQTGVTTSNRCVFLNNEGACGIYESRPSTCRRHSVISSPKLCEDPMGIQQPRSVPMADIIISAAFGLSGNSTGSISKMLMPELENLVEEVNTEESPSA